MALPNLPAISDPIPNGPFSSPPVPATFDRLFGTLVPNIQLDPNPSDIVPDSGDEWVRPADWLPMPTVSDTEQKLVGLFAIYNLPRNPIAVFFDGDYTVNWGDGTVENFNAGEKAQHDYNWDDVSASTTTTQGYRQVLVTVTPQTGEDLTYCDLGVRHDDITEDYSGSPWLDLILSMPAAGPGGNIYFYNDSTYANLPLVQRVQIINAGSSAYFSYLFEYAYSLQEFVLGPNAVSAYSAIFGSYNGALKTIRFQNITSLDNVAGILSQVYYRPVSVYLSNVTGVTDASGLLQNNPKVKKVVIDGAPDLENLDNAFSNCSSLETVSISGVPNLETLVYTFDSCEVLRTATLEDCGSVTDFSSTFSYCYKLQEASIGETPLLFSTEDMFYSCYGLEYAPELNMQNVEMADSMFYYCYSLAYSPDYNTSSLVSSSGMYNSCTALIEAPTLDTSNIETALGMFGDCFSLTKVPDYDFSSATALSGIFSYDRYLQLAPIKNVSVDISFADCLLGRDAIVEIFQGLATASAEIDVSGNYGAADLTAEDLAIATDKGWTVIS